MANDFYVHIVESPSPDELLDGITEGGALCGFLDIAGIQYSYNLAIDLDQFDIAMTNRVEEAIDKFRKIPILHLSTHGNGQGIQLTDQSLFSWPVLADYLRPIHEYIGGLDVCMSCCYGAYGTQMAEEIKKINIPYRWIAGSFSEIYLRDAILAYATLYLGLHSGVDDDDIRCLIRAIQVATGISDFDIWHGELVQEAYSQELIEEIRKEICKEILERIRRRHRGMP